MGYLYGGVNSSAHVLMEYTSGVLYNILNINNVYFDNMVSQVYPSDLQLNKANTYNAEAAYLDIYFSISNDIVSNKMYNKRDDLILKLSISHF